MAESLAESIIVAFKTRLASIVSDGGTNYWYTPTAVARIENWAAWEPEWFDHTTLTTIYLIRAGDEVIVEHAGHSIDRELEMFVIGGTLHDTATLNPFQITGTLGQTKQNRIVRDVQKAIAQDITFGISGVINTEITDVGRDVPFVENWALVQFRIKCLYSTLDTNP